MASETPTISIKLLVDQVSNVVLLAESGNDFVDTVHSLLKLPLGNIARLAEKHQSLRPGCLNNLYNSVQNLDRESFRTEECKRMLLYPRNVHDVEFKKLKLNMDLTGRTGYYVCGNGECDEKQDAWFSYYDTRRCTCGNLINSKPTKTCEFSPDDDETEGVLLYRGKSMFFVTDDLRVMQGFPGDLIQFLLDMGFKNVGRIEEKVVEFGSKEMTHLLIHSLFSKTTLTDVFLKKQVNSPTSPILDEHFSFIVPSEMELTEKVRKIRVKMLLRKSDGKILHVEASEKFVDLLFTFLTIPLESVLELILGAKGNLTLGSISNLFRDLNSIFSESNQESSQKGVLPPFYSCPNVFPNIRSRDPPICIEVESSLLFCRKPLDPKSPVLCSTNSSGYVQKNSLFVITDDLVVKPLSLISSIRLLKETGIELDDVQHKVISIGEGQQKAWIKKKDDVAASTDFRGKLVVDSSVSLPSCSGLAFPVILSDIVDITEGITTIPVPATGGNDPSTVCAKTAIASSSAAIIALENCDVSGDVLEVVGDILVVAPDDVTIDANSPVAQALAGGTRVMREAAKGVNQASNAVLLAEAGSDFVNTIHSLLKLPLGNIARLADKHQSLLPGCLNNLYNSVNNLSLECFRTEECKRMLLCPRNVHASVFKDLKLNMDLTGSTGYYICSNMDCNEQYGWFSYYDTRRCSCGYLMNLKPAKIFEPVTGGVLYKGKSMFFVTDDLRVRQGLPGDLIHFLLNKGFENFYYIDGCFLKKQRFGGTTPMFDDWLSFIAPVEKKSAEKDGKTRVKMLLRKSDSKVLYAEASEKFIDLLFTFLTIPLETVLEHILGLKDNRTLGSISNLFRELNTLFSVSKKMNSQKGVLPPFYSCPNEFPNIRSQDPASYIVYYFGDCKKPLDPKSCKRRSKNSSGYVAKKLLFVVSDDLVVRQLSLVSSISLLKETGVSLRNVEQKIISIGEVEAIALLGASLWTSSPLSALLNSLVKKPKQETV
ncbi:hypothetical protein GQ457_14G023670 [Hibiscus cannabinus]